MRYLKVTPPADDRKGTYATIRDIIEVAPAGGYHLAEMRRRFRLLDIVNAAEAKDAAVLELEDDHAQCVQECLDAARFATLSIEAVEFEDAVKAMLSGETAAPAPAE